MFFFPSSFHSFFWFWNSRHHFLVIFFSTKCISFVLQRTRGKNYFGLRRGIRKNGCNRLFVVSVFWLANVGAHSIFIHFDFKFISIRCLLCCFPLYKIPCTIFSFLCFRTDAIWDLYRCCVFKYLWARLIFECRLKSFSDWIMLLENKNDRNENFAFFLSLFFPSSP